MVSKKRAGKKRTAKLATKTTGRRRSTRKRGIANRAGHDAIVIERRAQALQLRLAGARYRQIAVELKCSLNQAWKDVQNALTETNTLCSEQAEELRSLELERYDGYLRALQPLIDGTESVAKLRAIGVAINISARRAKLLGLDVVPTGPSVDEFMRTAATLATIIQTHVRDQRIVDVIADQFEATLERLVPAGLAVIENTPLHLDRDGHFVNSGRHSTGSRSQEIGRRRTERP